MDKIEKVVKKIGYDNYNIIRTEKSYQIELNNITNKNFLDFKHYITKKEFKVLESLLRDDIISDILEEEKEGYNIYKWKVGDTVLYNMDVLFISTMIDSKITSLTDGLTSLVYPNMHSNSFKLTPDNLSLSIDFKRFLHILKDYKNKDDIIDIINNNWSNAMENNKKWQKYFNYVDREVSNFILMNRYL